MECVNSSKTELDDTEQLTAVIETTANMQGHTEYIIRVQRGPQEESCWQIRRRYNDFAVLHSALATSCLNLPLPPKKMFGNMDREFISVRQQRLQNYLDLVLTHPMLASSLHVKRFMDPVHYMEHFQEKALQHVYMMFRCEPSWTMVEALPDIGWRLRRHYFLVRNQDDSKQDYMLSWCNYGPDACLNDKGLRYVMSSLAQVSHPLIATPKMASGDKTGGTIIHAYTEDGSLRDFMCRAKPKSLYLRKYCQPKERASFSSNEVAAHGKLILEALKFLHDKNFPYGHLHAGNLLMVDDGCQLSGLENSFLGLPPYYRSFATQLRKVKTLKDLDVYAFGHVMYEMVFGEALNAPTCDNYPGSCSPTIKSVLESILTTEACNGGLPSVEHLLTHPLFVGIHLSVGNCGKGHMKVTSQMRESLRAVQTRIEARLLHDQKMLRRIERISKAQSILLENKAQPPPKNNVHTKKIIKADSKGVGSASPSESTENGGSTLLAPTPPPVTQAQGVRRGPYGLNPSPIPPPLPQSSHILSDIKTCSPCSSSSGYESSALSPDDGRRSLLLDSIQNFKRGQLKKAEIKDCSQPIL